MLETGQLEAFFLVFLRSAAFMMAGPLYTLKGLPSLVKIGFALILAVVVFPIVEVRLFEDTWMYWLAALGEIGAGLLLGAAVTMIINSIRMAGQFIDFQIGYSMANLVDPATGTSTTLLGQYLYLLGLIFFLMVDGHYTLIAALFGSYQLVPLGMANLGGGAAVGIMQIFAKTFVYALQVAAPIIAILLIADLSLGFLTRTTPQINVFLTGFPVKMIVGLLTLSFLIPLFGAVFNSIFNTIERDLYLLMRELVFNGR
ncbi:MAG: flagellar biosynthetic protein FliR [Pelotomaculum sp.]